MDYIKDHFTRAFRNTVAFLREHIAMESIATIASGIIGLFSKQGLFTSVLIIPLSTLAAMILIVFLYNLVLSPFRLYKEHKTELVGFRNISQKDHDYLKDHVVILLSNTRSFWKRQEHSDNYLVCNFKVFNGTDFKIELDKNISGEAKYDGSRIDNIRLDHPTGEHNEYPPRDKFDVRIELKIPKDIEENGWRKNAPIECDFSGVIIPIKAIDDPKGSVKQFCLDVGKLSIPQG